VILNFSDSINGRTPIIFSPGAGTIKLCTFKNKLIRSKYFNIMYKLLRSLLVVAGKLVKEQVKNIQLLLSVTLDFVCQE
jgi:hypothetical protein